MSVFPGHDPAHQAAIVVFDAATGTPAALMDGDAITAARTAAGSRLATRLLAREDADVLAVIGTGVQGEAHVTALRREREVGRSARVGAAPEAPRGRSPPATDADRRPRPSRTRCAAPASCAWPPRATEPVLRREWVAPGAHVNSVGFTSPGRELDPALVADALVVVESRGSALAPPPAGSTDLEGATAHAELGELVAGTNRAARAREQLTLYKSVGVGVEDDAAAGLALRRAEERALGTRRRALRRGSRERSRSSHQAPARSSPRTRTARG